MEHEGPGRAAEGGGGDHRPDDVPADPDRFEAFTDRRRIRGTVETPAGAGWLVSGTPTARVMTSTAVYGTSATTIQGSIWQLTPYGMEILSQTDIPRFEVTCAGESAICTVDSVSPSSMGSAMIEFRVSRCLFCKKPISLRWLESQGGNFRENEKAHRSHPAGGGPRRRDCADGRPSDRSYSEQHHKRYCRVLRRGPRKVRPHELAASKRLPLGERPYRIQEDRKRQGKKGLGIWS
jgi:hypothetical protein